VVDRSKLYAIIDQMKSEAGGSTATAAPKRAKTTKVAKK
jgi:hypothetical protein